ncbi:MAG: TPM domain-containing protein [Myxococcales bacterium]|nr:TPM domain-containing protein [Myxococcales bacterium]
MGWWTRFCLIVAVALTATMVSTSTSAQERGEGYLFPEIPEEREFILDNADLLSGSDDVAIREIADTLLTDKAVPIIVVTIPSLAAYNAYGGIESYARDLFDEWGIGLAEWNYGILLVVAVDDRKARIELGADWGQSKNGDTDTIMNTLIVPAFKRGDYSEGIAAGVRGLDAMARDLAIPSPPKPAWYYPTIIGLGLLAVFTFVSLYRRGASGWAWVFWAAVFAVAFLILRAAASSSSSGSGGYSGGSFGGGSSGGGGSTGSW